MKICGKCKQEKELECFSFKNKNKGTYSSECKDCHKIMRRAYYESNTEVEKARAKHVKKTRNDWYKSLKASLACVKCGEDHPATLHFHHLDPTEKDFNIAVAMGRGLGKSKLLEEMNKCEVLCANCHAKLHWVS